MGRKRFPISIQMATLIFIVVIFFFILKNPTMVGMDPTTGGILFDLLPGLLLVIIFIYVAVEIRGVGRIGSIMGVGVALCYLLNQANILNLITTEMLSGLTIAQLQIWTMIIATIMGAVIYATS